MNLERILAVVSSGTAVGLGLLYVRERHRKKMAEESAYRDSGTGLYNMRYFFEEAPLSLAEAKRYNEEGALLFIDVDNLKHINDTISHLFGDEVLSALAGAIKESVREIDIAARYGGDEFLVYLKRIDGNSILVKERIQEVFQKKLQSLFDMSELRSNSEHAQKSYRIFDTAKHSAPAHLAVSISASIGIANAKEANYSLTAMIELAESRMYEEKRTNGRSRN